MCLQNSLGFTLANHGHRPAKLPEPFLEMIVVQSLVAVIIVVYFAVLISFTICSVDERLAE